MMGKTGFKFLNVVIPFAVMISLLSIPFFSGIEGSSPIPIYSIATRAGDVDTDNDGVIDSEDICPDGNGIIIISIDYFETEETTFEDYDPYFNLGIDGNNNGELDENEIFDSEKFYFPDQNLIEYQGFGEGILWHGVDVDDDLISTTFFIAAYDRDMDTNDLMDITSDNDTMIQIGTYEIWDESNKVQQQAFFDDGELDTDWLEDDAYIEFHLEVIKGTTIESTDPQPTSEQTFEPRYTIREGDIKTFEVTNVFNPLVIDAPVGYEWYIMFYDEDLEEWNEDSYCVQKYYEVDYEDDDFEVVDHPNKFDMYANYGSTGIYLLYCVAFSDMIEDFNLYWWDCEIWLIEIEHHNTIPKAIIDVTPEENIRQFDTISISAWKSTDVDADELTYNWSIDGDKVGSEMEFNTVFLDAGPHSIKLIVEDDEGAKSTVYKNLTVQNIDTSMATINAGPLILDEPIIFDLNTTETVVFRRSQSLSFDILFGYSLRFSASFVSEAIVEHIGEATMIYHEENENLTLELTEIEDSFFISYIPYFEFLIELYDDNEEHTILDLTLPVPILSNIDGLDEDGVPLIDIPEFMGQNIDVYTWDLPKLIYEDLTPQSNRLGEFKLETETVNIAQIDIFEFAKAVTAWTPPTISTAIGVGIDIVKYFANLFLECNLNFGTIVRQDLYQVIDEEENEFNRILHINNIDEKFVVTNQEINLFMFFKIGITIDLSLSLDLHFNLTGAGQRVYGVISDIRENGLIIGLFNTVKSFFTTGDVQKKDLDLRKTLWSSGTLLTMEGGGLYIYDEYDEYSSDMDDDGRKNWMDPFPLDPSAWIDTDGDGMPDHITGTSTTGLIEDDDDDNDGVPDTIDAFQYDPSAWMDTDGDGKPDFINGTSNSGLIEDLDDDNDGVPDTTDAFQYDPSAWMDTDGDGKPDFINGTSESGLIEDDDDDDDGILDTEDRFPTDPSAWEDTDDDGKPDTLNGTSTTGLIEDDDDDDDGVPDVEDAYPKDPTKSVVEEEKNDSLLIIILILGGFILLVIILVIFMLIKKSRSNKETSTVAPIPPAAATEKPVPEQQPLHPPQNGSVETVSEEEVESSEPDLPSISDDMDVENKELPLEDKTNEVSKSVNTTEVTNPETELTKNEKNIENGIDHGGE